MPLAINVTMPDGSVWQVPARLVGENRLAYYAQRGTPVEDPDEAEELCTDKGELSDWGRNNMNWEDVAAHATQLPTPPREVDYQEGWVNGEWEFMEVPDAAPAEE